MKDLRANASELLKRVSENKKKDILNMKDHKNDLLWLVKKIKDSERNDYVKNETKNTFQTEILSLLKYQIFAEKFGNLTNYLEEQILPPL